MPPPPRRVIIERLPNLPAPPPSLLIERWLPYPKQKRKVVFKKEKILNTVYERPKNVIIEWEPIHSIHPKQLFLKKFMFSL